MRYLLTTDQGLEDVAAEEVSERLFTSTIHQRPYGYDGQILVESVEFDPILELTTVHDVLEIRHEAEAASVETVAEIVTGIDLPELAEATSFRVTSRRIGEHTFRRTDLERAAGGVLFRRYATPVALTGFEQEIRVDLYGDRLIVGISHTAAPLGKRIHRAKVLRSGLKPTIAAAMLRLVGAHTGDGRLIDPLCGIGTIPIEASRINPELDVSASDWDPETVEAARSTVANHGLDIPVSTLDARTLGKLHAGAFDFIVTDPPYGVRQARRTSVARLYGSLMSAFAAALAPEGRLGIVVVKFRTFEKALSGSGLEIVHSRAIETGGLRLRIVIARRASPG